MPPKKAVNTTITGYVQRMSEESDKGERPGWASELVEGFKEVRQEILDLREEIRVEWSDKLKAVEQKMGETEKKIEDMEFNSRQYNILIWGLNPNNANCEEKVKQFFRTDLDIEEEIQLAACHPLGGGMAIARFVRMKDKETVLGSGKKLKGKKIAMKSDLPPRLRALRNTLNQQAKTMRQDGRIVRVIERGKTVLLQEKEDGKGQWKNIG